MIKEFHFDPDSREDKKNNIALIVLFIVLPIIMILTYRVIKDNPSPFILFSLLFLSLIYITYKEKLFGDKRKINRILVNILSKEITVITFDNSQLTASLDKVRFIPTRFGDISNILIKWKTYYGILNMTDYKELIDLLYKYSK